MKINREAGKAREQEMRQFYEKEYGQENVLRERYLYDQNGKVVRDPAEGQARRLDFVVKESDGKYYAKEVTSKTAPKGKQMDKERRIRGIGGQYVKDGKGGLVHVENDSEIVRKD